MKYLLKGGKVYKDNTFQDLDILVEDDRIVSISREIIPDGDSYLIDCKDKIVIPGLIDVHVHLREPGFLYKETIRTGSMAGAHGGYTTICPMPNLNPTPDSIPNLQVELDAIEKDAVIHVLPFGTITVGEKGEQLSDIRGMADMVVGYSDDGHGVQSDDLMRQAMKEIAGLGKILSAHCEVNSLSGDGYIHDGEYARLHGHKGISSESEWAEIALRLYGRRLSIIKGNRLQIPCMSRIYQGKRGYNQKGKGSGHRCHGRDRPSLSCTFRKGPDR